MNVRGDLYLAVLFPVLVDFTLYNKAESCLIFKEYRLTYFSTFEEGHSSLGTFATVNVSSSTLSQCAQLCRDIPCKSFVYSRLSDRRCSLSTLSQDCSDHERTTPQRHPVVVYRSCTKECNDSNIKALGMESGEIPDSAITASSEHAEGDKRAINARLNSEGGWSSPWISGLMSHNYWIMVSFNNTAMIHRLATQGCFPCVGRWVKKYSVHYTTSRKSWHVYTEGGYPKIFTGNTDKTTVVVNEFHHPIVADQFKIYTEEIKAVLIYTVPSLALGLRFEIYGCWL